MLMQSRAFERSRVASGNENCKTRRITVFTCTCSPTPASGTQVSRAATIQLGVGRGRGVSRGRLHVLGPIHRLHSRWVHSFPLLQRADKPSISPCCRTETHPLIK